MANPNWIKGVSGNPNGRPKKTEQQSKFEQLCRDFMATEGAAILLAAARGTDKKMKAWAIDTMKEYGFGKAVNREILELGDVIEDDISDDELLKEIEALQKNGKQVKRETDCPGSQAAPKA